MLCVDWNLQINLYVKESVTQLFHFKTNKTPSIYLRLRFMVFSKATD